MPYLLGYYTFDVPDKNVLKLNLPIIFIFSIVINAFRVIFNANVPLARRAWNTFIANQFELLDACTDVSLSTVSVGTLIHSMA